MGSPWNSLYLSDLSEHRYCLTLELCLEMPVLHTLFLHWDVTEEILPRIHTVIIIATQLYNNYDCNNNNNINYL